MVDFVTIILIFSHEIELFEEPSLLICFCLLYTCTIWVMSFPCLHKRSLHRVWSKFRSFKNLENVYLRYFLVCGRPHELLLTSLPLSFTCPHPTAVLAFSSAKSEPHAHPLCGHHKWMTPKIAHKYNFMLPTVFL